ncbi:MAG: serine/threonine-protein kinase [Terracidiphilus sp.]|jgi:serine/threonine-protein kinase
MKTCPVCDTDYPDQHSTCPNDGAVLIVSRELVPGSLVRGKYRIVSKLGEGGMGVVYQAEHILLGGRVALKFLAGDLGNDPKFIKRFRMEARAAYQLRHPNIVEVTDLDQGEDGSLFIAMEYVEGPSLRTVLDEAPHGLAISRALEIARGIASGLAAAHGHGTVHRDIKPENILLATGADGRERPKILDFGIVAMAENVTRVSRTRGLLLTPDYAAPEQWMEMPSAEIDGRTDIYALGCVFYEMLTGRTPFHAHNTAGWLKQHLDELAKAPSLVRPELAGWQGLDGLVLRMLAKDRALRHRDAAELLGLLDEVHLVSAEERARAAGEESRKRAETITEERMVRAETIIEKHAPTPAPTPKPTPKPPEPRKERQAAETEDAKGARPAEKPIKQGFWRRVGNLFGTPATAAAAQPGTKLGGWWVAGRILLAVWLIVQGLHWMLPNQLPPDFRKWYADLGNVEFYFLFLKIAGGALVASGLAIAISRRTRVAGALVGAIALQLDFVCHAVFLASFMSHGLGKLALWEAGDGFRSLGLGGAVLMVAGLQVRKGRIGRLFPAGRTLFATAMPAAIATQTVSSFLVSLPRPMMWVFYGAPYAVWGRIWLGYLFVPAMVLACVCLLFRRPARAAAFFLCAATLVNLPLFCVLWHGNFSQREWVLLLLSWLLELGVAGGALVVAAAMGKGSGAVANEVPKQKGRGWLGRFLRRRWVRWVGGIAALVVAAALTLHGVAPYLFYRACTGESAAKVDAAGWLYKTVNVLDWSLKRSIEWAENDAHKCSSGDADGCLGVGNFYRDGHRDTAKGERAEHFYTKAADLYGTRCSNMGDAGGCYALGLLYHEGRGTYGSDSRAVQLFERSCNYGATYGCKALAHAYRNGEGVGRDVAKAEALYTKACKGSRDYDCASIFDGLGDIYYFGRGVARNYDKAGALYKKACDGGYSTGCYDLFNVAYAFHAGKDAAVNYAKAAALYPSACNGGVSTACADLGALYRWGLGVTQDDAKARELFTKSCGMGETWGCDRLKEMQ